jgi:hypothetical protein
VRGAFEQQLLLNVPELELQVHHFHSGIVFLVFLFGAKSVELIGDRVTFSAIHASQDGQDESSAIKSAQRVQGPLEHGFFVLTFASRVAAAVAAVRRVVVRKRRGVVLGRAGPADSGVRLRGLASAT